MMWRENVTFSNIEKVLLKYENLLLVTTHEYINEMDSFCLR